MPTISLCMIVRNEENVLARCLESVKDVVDEIIIVDTGSADRTKEIAAFYTDKIFDFIWIDHFSAARNYSFSKATKEYYMWMDADDVLPENEKQKLLQWKRNSISKEQLPDVIMMKYVTAFDEFGKGIFSFYRERILRRDIRCFWKGRVHEAIVPFGKVEYLDISIEHRSEKETYSDRNLKMLPLFSLPRIFPLFNFLHFLVQVQSLVFFAFHPVVENLCRNIINVPIATVIVMNANREFLFITVPVTLFNIVDIYIRF